MPMQEGRRSDDLSLPPAEADGGPTEIVPIWLGATPTGAQLEHLPLERFHRAVDQLEADTVPESYWRKVLESRRAGPPDRPPPEPTPEAPR